MTPAPISVDRLRELLDKATPGPWSQDHRRGKDGGYRTQVFDASGDEIATLAWHAKPPRYEDGRKIISTDRAENAELIVAMHEALPTLLQQLAERDAEVERLQAELDFMTAHYERMTSHMVCHRGALIYANAGMRDAYSEEHVRAEAAERAREEARILIEDAGSALRVIIATAEAARWPITAEQMVPLNMARKEAGRIAAFLAASGGAK